uniref:Uncharacterized protein n=1 Tax=Arundo donax TaxID=35708 RepID=A0A0A9FUL1_ARUDO
MLIASISDDVQFENFMVNHFKSAASWWVCIMYLEALRFFTQARKCFMALFYKANLQLALLRMATFPNSKRPFKCL